MRTLNERSKKNLDGVHPNLLKVLEMAITEVDFTVTEGVRTVARQQELYAQGRTTTGKIVTNADGVKVRSNHQPKEDGYGYAVDIYANPINVNDSTRIGIVASIIKRTAKSLGLTIEWGGDWKMKDYPHFDLKK